MTVDLCDCCEDDEIYARCSTCRNEACHSCTKYLEKHGYVCEICYDELPEEDFNEEEKKQAGIIKK